MRTTLVPSAGQVSIVGSFASLGRANRGGGTLLQGLGQGLSPPSGRRFRGRGPQFLDRGVLGVLIWISIFLFYFHIFELDYSDYENQTQLNYYMIC